MSYLINRNPAARIECLHALMQFISDKFNLSSTFHINDVKFQRDDINIHKYCSLLVDSEIGIQYCPYKQNPLDDAGCSLTNGVEDDTTKSKEVSNTINALHALGFIQRDKRELRLTQQGLDFAHAEYGSSNMQKIITRAVLSYGPIIGVLSQIMDKMDMNRTFNSKEIDVGYPSTKETILYEGYNVILSTGSQKDSNTRTRSCLLAWLTTSGIIRPINLPEPKEGELPHWKYKDFLNQAHRGEEIYVLNKNFSLPSEFIVEKPLDYANLTKLTTALRENNMSNIRRATMLYENIIKNRRFAIAYLLNQAYTQQECVEYTTLIKFLASHPDLFVINKEQLAKVIQKEIEICFMVGIPYKIITKDNKLFLKPLVGINIKELTSSAPNSLLSIFNNF